MISQILSNFDIHFICLFLLNCNHQSQSCLKQILLSVAQICQVQLIKDLYKIMAQIFIKIDKPFYFAGDTIMGEVFFYLYEPMNANEVLIKFKGWQEAKWIDERTIINEEQKARIQSHLIWSHDPVLKMDTTDSSSEQGDDYARVGGNIKQYFKRSGGRLIIKTTNILHNFGGQFIPPGQYVFPFSYKTAQNYPASFTNKSQDCKSKGRIKYEMRVFVRGFNSRRRLIKHSTQIVVRETAVIKNDQQQMVANVKSCCCINKGISKIRCYFEKNAYMPGEEAKIYCVLDNTQSLADITRVTVKLVNQITYTSKENLHKNFQINIFTNEFPGLPRGDHIQRNKAVMIINSSNKNADPHFIMPTARGQRVKSVYFLRVQAELDASCTCCSQLPVVYQPIVIYPYITVNYFFKQPSNWNPMKMAMVDLQRAVDVNNSNLQKMNNPYY